MVIANVIGRLGADAEIVNGQKGQFVSFRMASNDVRTINGERKEITSWFRVTLDGDRFLKLAEYLKKGKQVYVTGREFVGTFPAKDGTTQISRDITGLNVEFINTGSSNGQASNDTSVSANEAITTGTFAPTPMVEPAVTPTPSTAADDLPF